MCFFWHHISLWFFLSRLPVVKLPVRTIAETLVARLIIGRSSIESAGPAVSLFRLHSPAYSPLLPRVTDQFDVLVCDFFLTATHMGFPPKMAHYLTLNTELVLVIPPEFFQPPQCFPVLNKYFLFRRHFHC